MGARAQKRTKRSSQDDYMYIKIIIAAIVFIVSIVLFTKSNNVNEKILVSYNTDSNIDYQVYLFNNDFIKTEYMEKGRTYVTALVDRIAMNMQFDMKSTKKLGSEYKYNVVAKAVVNKNSTGKELWSEEYVLISDMDYNVVDNKEIKIDASTVVPFNSINSKVKAFKTTYNLELQAFMDIKLNVIDKRTGRELASTGLSMDLNKDTFEIQELSTGKNVQNVVEKEKPNALLARIEIVVAIISLLYVASKTYRAITLNNVNKSYYTRAIYKILKNYGDIVAEIVKPVDLSNLKVIDVKNFDQMLDVEEELRIPIMYYEAVKNEEGIFVLVHNDMAYRYILRDRLKY